MNKTLRTFLQYDIEPHPIFRDFVLCLLRYLVLSDFKSDSFKWFYIFVKPKIGLQSCLDMSLSSSINKMRCNYLDHQYQELLTGTSVAIWPTVSALKIYRNFQIVTFCAKYNFLLYLCRFQINKVCFSKLVKKQWYFT